MIYDYDDQEGYVSIWIGNCTDYSVLEEYISTVYLDEEEDFDDGLHPPKRLEMYDFKYEGGIPEAEHEGVHLYFLGYAGYDINAK